MRRRFRRDGVELSGREHVMRAAEPNDRRPPDRFAEVDAIMKLGVRDRHECSERSVCVRRG